MTPANSAPIKERLKLTEIFYSLQGEGQHSGLPCIFVRLTGCALRCGYCDTEYAFHGGKWFDFAEIKQQLATYPCQLVQITGGEPLHQKAVWGLMDQLVQLGYSVLLETSGAVSIQGLNSEVHILMDVKTPESGESHRMLWENLEYLKPADELKFVVCSEKDLDWSLTFIRDRGLDQRFHVLISPVADWEPKHVLADKVLNSGLKLRFQVQLHKILWGDTPGK